MVVCVTPSIGNCNRFDDRDSFSLPPLFNSSDSLNFVFQMPVMDGYAAVRAIRKLEADRKATRRLPVFALTAHAMAEDEAKCLEAGMDRYLTKPLERGKLAEAIRAVMQE
jgi:CheY-like chemotaxis protein